MKYQVELLENWRPKFEFWTPGIYRVPEDFSEEKAAQMMREVKARKVSRKAPAPENKLLTVPENKAGKKTGAEKPLLSRRAERLKIGKT